MLLQLYWLKALLRSYVIELWARRWLAVTVAWVLGIAGMVALTFLPDYYRAYSRIYVDTSTLLQPLLKGLTVEPPAEQKADLMRKMLLTRYNLEQALMATGQAQSDTPPEEMDLLIQTATKKVGFDSDGRQMFTLSYENSDPEIALRMVEVLVGNFSEQQGGGSLKDIADSRNFIEEQINDYEQRLREIEARVGDFRREHGKDIAAKQSLQNRIQDAENDIRQLEKELLGAIWQRDQIKVTLSHIPEFLTPAQAATVAAKTPEEARLQELRDQLAMTRLHNTELHPDVIILRKQIEVLSTGRASKRGERRPQSADANPNPAYIQASLEMDKADLLIQSLQRRLKVRQEQAAEMREQVVDLPAIELTGAQLERDYEVLRKTYSELINRREAARMSQMVEEHGRATNFQVIEPPILPVRPAGPRRIFYLAALSAFSVAAGIGVALAHIQLRDTFSSTWQIHQSFDLPVLGSVSEITRQNTVHRLAGGLAFAVVFFGLIGFFGASFHMFRTHNMRVQVVEYVRSFYKDFSGDIRIMNAER